MFRIVIIILSLALAPLSAAASAGDDHRHCPQVIHTEIVVQPHAAPAAIALHCGASIAASVLPDAAVTDHSLSAGRRLVVVFANWSLASRTVAPNLPPPVIQAAA